MNDSVIQVKEISVEFWVRFVNKKQSGRKYIEILKI